MKSEIQKTCKSVNRELGSKLLNRIKLGHVILNICNDTLIMLYYIYKRMHAYSNFTTKRHHLIADGLNEVYSQSIIIYHSISTFAWSFNNVWTSDNSILRLFVANY